MTTEQIIERGDQPYGRRQKEFEIPVQGAVEFPARVLLIEPYVLGVWLGDGSSNSGRFTTVDAEIVEQVTACGYRVGGPTCEARTIYGIAPALRDLGVLGLRSHERSVPREYLTASVRQRKALLRGLMDTDGYVATDGHCEFTTTSIELAHDVVHLTRSLGGKSRVKPTVSVKSYMNPAGERVVCRKAYRVTVTTPFNPFTLTRKAARWHKPQARYLKRYIESIVPVGHGEAMCIEIAHPSNCYLTGDFVVTHNSALLAWIALNFLMTRPKPKIVCTAITWPNLRDNLWTEFSKWIERSAWLSAVVQWGQMKIALKENPQQSWIAARTWDRSADAENQGKTLSGLHADYILAIADETGGMPVAVVQSAEGILSTAKEGHIIQAGNPTHLSGALYEATERSGNLWRTYRVTGDPDDPKRSTRVDKEWARDQIRIWGRDSAFVRSKILGKYPNQATDALVGLAEMEDCFGRGASKEIEDLPSRPLRRGIKALGVDVARFGNDRTVICVRDGEFIDDFFDWGGKDTEYTADRVARMAVDMQIHTIVVDDIGVGGGVTDKLKKLAKGRKGMLSGVKIVGLNVGVASKIMDRKKQPTYFNKKAEINVKAKNEIEEGRICFAPKLRNSTTIVEEATDIRYTFAGDGKTIRIESKDDYRERHNQRSPDYWDALVLALTARKISLQGYGWR